jgi:hypothetical protein
MLPVLRRFSERIAFGYFGARIMDAVFAVGVMQAAQRALGGEHAQLRPTPAA